MTDRCWDTDPRVRSTAGYGVAGGESVTVPEEGSLQKRQRRWWWRALAVLTPPVCPGPLRRPRDGLEVNVIMDAEGSMSSASGVESSLVPVLFPSKKGGEIALPTCVHCHVTLLVNSKTPQEAILHPTLKGQRDRGRYVEPCTPMRLEIQQLRLNQQSHGFLYIYAE